MDRRAGGYLMLEPQSWLLFALLIVLFAAVIWWVAVARRLTLKVVAGCLSFVIAMSFGVLSVNKYFGYYATWSAAAADFSNSSPNSGPEISQGSLLSGNKNPTFDQHAVYLRLALQQGYTFHVAITGKLSHITRQVYVYLPPEYFESRYANYKFPVIELIHGQPGEPQDWVNVVGIEQTMNQLVSRGQASPAVLVMPDVNGGNRISLQCLNQVGGPADLTYLGQDVPDVIGHMLHVMPPGNAWGVAGFSEGGFCAANMALQFRYRYGYAASMSGYFSPQDNKLGNPARSVDPFDGNNTLRVQNTPIDAVRALAPGARLPLFWLGAGQGSSADANNANYFAQELQLHEADVPVVVTPGGGHTMGTWHALVPPMLTWMTEGLAQTAAHDNLIQLARAKADQRADERASHSPSTGHDGTSSSPGPSHSSTPGP
jgi:enterochelin esterase-like enzyme